MEYKQKKEYLSQYQSTQRRIKGLIREAKRWEDVETAINQTYNAAPGGGGKKGAKYEKPAQNRIDILATIKQELKTAEEQRETIKDTIEQKSARFRHAELLRLVFVNGMKPSEVAELYGKETKTINNAITNAIKALDI